MVTKSCRVVPMEWAKYRSSAVLAIALFAIASPRLMAMQVTSQGSDSSKPAHDIAKFDVVVIKPASPGLLRPTITPGLDTFEASDVSLARLIQYAFNLRSNQIFGLPSWAQSSAYSIAAKVVDADPNTLKSLSWDQRRQLVAQLLRDRFGLQVHFGTKVMPVYRLVLDRPTVRMAETKTKPASDDSEVQSPQKGGNNLFVANGFMEGTGVSVADLTAGLALAINQDVINDTGLTGKYDVSLRWTPEQSGTLTTGLADNKEDALPPIFTAIREQLGLKLVSGRGDVRVLYVDHAEEPSGN